MKIVDARKPPALKLNQIAVGAVFQLVGGSKVYQVLDSHARFDYDFQTVRAIVDLELGKIILTNVDSLVVVLTVELHIK